MNLSRLLEPFPENGIEWRIQQAGEANGKPWARVLAYISARSAQDRLDEVFGPLGWQVRYSFVPEAPKQSGGVLATILIWSADSKEWIFKTDGAEQTDIEPFKGGLSGAFKRAASTLGIGRYLYDLDAGFADITEKGAQGARWYQGKDKQGKELKFFWRPPKLPEWALPPQLSKK